MIRVLGISVKMNEIENLKDEDFEKMLKMEHSETIDKLGDQIDLVDKLFDDNKKYVALTTHLPKCIDLLFTADLSKKEQKEIINKLKENGFEAKTRGYGSIDERYITDNKFKGFAVDLPFDYIDKAICEMFDRLGLEYKIYENVEKNVVVYESDLGFQKLMFLANQKVLGGGIENRKTHISIRPQIDYKKVINGVEEDFTNWRKDHPEVVC